MTHTPPSEAAASSRSNLPDERALEHIARSEDGYYPPAMQAMAREILRMRAQCPPTEEVEQMRDELAQFRQAIGLMTTAKPDMQVDVRDPVGMARQVVEMVERLRQDGLTALSAAIEQKKRAETAESDRARLRAEKRDDIRAVKDHLQRAGIMGPPMLAPTPGVPIGEPMTIPDVVKQLATDLADTRSDRDAWKRHATERGGDLNRIRSLVPNADEQSPTFDVVELELRRLRALFDRLQAVDAKQQALLNEIARLFPGKGPLLERVRAAAKVVEQDAIAARVCKELDLDPKKVWLEAMRRTEPKRDVALAPIKSDVDEAVRKVLEQRLMDGGFPAFGDPFGLLTRRSCKEPKVGSATGQPRTEVPVGPDVTGTVVELGEAFRRNLANAVDCLPSDGHPTDATTVKIAIRNLHGAVAELAKVVERGGAR